MQTLTLGLACGAAVGFILGLIGGGGSILAVPLLIYVVGVSSPHVAIGTSSVAVAASAAVGFIFHARHGTVKWRCAAVLAFAGSIGAWMGALLGKATDGQRLLALFGAAMMIVGLLALRRWGQGEKPDVRLDMASAGVLMPRLLATGVAAGLGAGYFGIGGGFLIVPALILATSMPMIAAIGSSLLAVTVFGVTTAASYSLAGLVDWPLAGAFVVGGTLGGVPGSFLAVRFARRRRLLNVIFAVLVIGVGAYILLRGLPALLHSPKWPT